ncbi:hypothetical protein [Prosthecobacter sp.]|uniref:hypothetical protein n=1 Tax=Prosthecobacter sp. TaxID=1965333 RepID=UPI001D7B7258|nr:hypothetical protein [Prosthecobacter sp.]MCB1276005.1 hypothetical protein [Prosthecobacter sp.]
MEFLEAMIAGWSYLFSRSYRLKKHCEWQQNGGCSMLMGLAFGFAGILLSLALLALAVWLVWRSYCS